MLPEAASGAGPCAPPNALESLRRTRPWVLFLGVMSIVGAVFSGLYVLLGLIGSLAAAGLHAAGAHAGANAMVGPMMGFVLVYGGVMLTVTILAAVWLLRYAGAIQTLTRAPETGEQALERALVTQRKLWIMLGVVAIVGAVLGILFTALFAAAVPHLPPVQDLRA